jgi:hypothetical protein
LTESVVEGELAPCRVWVLTHDVCMKQYRTCLHQRVIVGGAQRVACHAHVTSRLTRGNYSRCLQIEGPDSASPIAS